MTGDETLNYELVGHDRLTPVLRRFAGQLAQLTPQVLAISTYLRSECCNAPVEQTHEPESNLYPVRCARCHREAGAPGAEDVPEAEVAVLAARWRQTHGALKFRTLHLSYKPSPDPRAHFRVSGV